MTISVEDQEATRSGKKPKAAIAVTFTDAAGNQATASKTVKLKD